MIDVDISTRGFPQVSLNLASIPKQLRHVIPPAILASVLVVHREARRNAPYLTGTLESSIKYKAGDDEGAVFVPINSHAGDYARRRHEDQYSRGPGTRAKGARAGRKYLERAVTDNADKIRLIFQQAAGNVRL